MTTVRGLLVGTGAQARTGHAHIRQRGGSHSGTNRIVAPSKISGQCRLSGMVNDSADQRPKTGIAGQPTDAWCERTAWFRMIRYVPLEDRPAIIPVFRGLGVSCRLKRRSSVAINRWKS